MDISSLKVYEILKDKGVETIFHSNSVITSCQFLRHGALMSRGTVERKGLFQTAQMSDEFDRNYGLWFDVFTDSVDIHRRAKRANAYGPVLFIFDVAIIRKAYTGRVWVTKLNPTKWEGKSRSEKWFSSAEDLSDNYQKGRFDQMIVFRHCGGELPFQKYLKEVILDDPNMKSKGVGIDFYSMAYGALALARTEGRVDVPIRKRKCARGCSCVSEYKENKDKTKELYVPRI